MRRLEEANLCRLHLLHWVNMTMIDDHVFSRILLNADDDLFFLNLFADYVTEVHIPFYHAILDSIRMHFLQ